jgi:hypothetical protein
MPLARFDAPFEHPEDEARARRGRKFIQSHMTVLAGIDFFRKLPTPHRREIKFSRTAVTKDKLADSFEAGERVNRTNCRAYGTGLGFCTQTRLNSLFPHDMFPVTKESLMPHWVPVALFASTFFPAGLLSAAGPTSPPFTQCPQLGADTSCAVLIIFNPDGSPTIKTDPSQGPYDKIEDTLVGVQNNSNKPVFSISISSTAGIFGFDDDGVCGSDPNTGLPYNPRPAGCPFGPTGYEGKTSSRGAVIFKINNVNSGIVNFPGGIPASGSAWFTLEEANFTINLCGVGSAPVVEAISSFPSCGSSTIPPGSDHAVLSPKWGQFGFKAALMSDTGEKLELQCDGGTNPATGTPYLPSYHLYYNLNYAQK